MFDYSDEDSAKLPLEKPKLVEQRPLVAKRYTQAVIKALEEIRSGNYEKIVLARGIELLAEEHWQPLDALNRFTRAVCSMLHVFPSAAARAAVLLERARNVFCD